MRNIEGLRLEYRLNKDSLDILKGIFIEREYADYFPFSESATIIDIGGHYGYFSLFAARCTAPDARIFVLEPSSRNFHILRHNLQMNQIENVVLLPVGLAARAGSAPLFRHLHTYNDSTADYSDEKETVKVWSLSDVLINHQLDEVDFLKMDCEGAEYDILLNTPKETFDKIKTISMEFHDSPKNGYTPNHLAAFLVKQGFQITKFTYTRAYHDVNFGKMIATKILTP